MNDFFGHFQEKQRNRLSDSFDSSPVSSGTDVSSNKSPESINTSRSPADVNANNRNKTVSQNYDRRTMAVEKNKPVPSKGTDKTNDPKPVSKIDRVIKEQRTRIPAPVQNTKKTQQKGKVKPTSKSQGKALTNLKKSSSMSSLPNPAKIPGTPSYPIPKPPSTKMTELQARRSNMLMMGRISFSNPDLHDFDDDNSLSCKSESGISRNSKKRKSKSAWQHSNQHSASDPDISRNEVDESQGFVLSPEDPILKSPQIHRLKKQQRSAGSNPELSSKKYSPEIDTEKFRKEVVDAKRKSPKFENKGTKGRKKPSAGKEIPSKDLTKPQEVSHEQKSDEPQSLNDLPSLDDCNSLPHEFNGIPLTSVRQQEIGQVLAKLSKCLNLQDTGGTLNSTSSSSSSTENNIKQSVKSKNSADVKKTVDDDKKQKYFSSPTLLEDNSLNSGNDNRSEVNLSGLNQSAVNSSVMSSVGSVGTNQSRRTSPKGLKNTVHFSSFVTEISTSASQSVEDKISVRKMDITPSNSTEFKETTELSNSSEIQNQGQYGKSLSKNGNDLGSAVPQVTIPTTRPYNSLIPGQPGSMLSKVALSPDESPGSTPKTFFKDQEVPFHVYTAEIEHNTSDKENENIYQKKYPVDVPDKLQLLENELSKNCEQTYGNIFMLTGKRSNDSDDRSQGSTLKESQENIIPGQRPYFKNDIYSEGNKTDFEKVMKVSSAVTGGSGHVIGEVSQSNQRSQGMCTATDKHSPAAGNGNLPKTATRPFSGHVRHGSYTLEQPCEALLKTQSTERNTQYSNFNNNGTRMNIGLDNSNNNATRMNIGLESLEPVSVSQNDMSFPTSESAEQSAKAEHIQRYLSQVQTHSAENELENSPQYLQNKHNVSIGQYEINEAVKSFTETLQSMESLSEEEMLKIQADHFNKIRQHLVEQQKQQLEELFVNQRREQMKLQDEIEVHHQHLREQQELFSSFSDPNNLSQYSVDYLQNTSLGSYNDLAQQFVQNSSVNRNFMQNNRVPMNAGGNFVSVSSQHPYIPANSTNNYVPNTYVPTNSGNGYVSTAAGNGYVPTTAGNGFVPTTTGNGYFPNGSMISNVADNFEHPVYSQVRYKKCTSLFYELIIHIQYTYIGRK